MLTNKFNDKTEIMAYLVEATCKFKVTFTTASSQTITVFCNSILNGNIDDDEWLTNLPESEFFESEEDIYE